jgi:hypothetical protein
LGREILPVGLIPITALPTIIKYGSPEYLCVETDAGILELPISDLSSYVSEAKNPRNTKSVRRVELGINSDFLRGGFQIIDTPGIDSVNEHNTEEALAFLPEVDVAIIVIGAEPPIGESELSFIRAIRPFASRFLFVQNKADRLTPKELEEALIYNCKILSDELDKEEAIVLPVSARMALLAISHAESRTQEASNLPELTRLIRSLLLDKRAVAKHSILKAMQGCLPCLETQLALELRGLVMEQEDLKERAADLSDELDRLRRSKDETLRSIHETIYRRVSELLNEDLERFRAEGRYVLTKKVSEAVNQGDSVANRISKVNKELATGLPELISPWAEKEAGKLILRTTELVSPLAIEIKSARYALIERASRAFDVTLPQTELDVRLSSTSRFHYHEWKLSLRFSNVERFFMLFLGNPFASTRLRKKALEIASFQFEMHTGRLRSDLMSRIGKALDQYKLDLDAVFEETANAIDSALLQFHQFVDNSERAQEKSREILQERHQRLEQIKAEMDSRERSLDKDL